MAHLRTKGTILDALATDVRALKAALLYADSVEIQLVSLAAKAGDTDGWPWSSDDEFTHALSVACLALRSPPRTPVASGVVDRPTKSEALADVRLAFASGALALRPDRTNQLPVPLSPPGRWLEDWSNTDQQGVWEGHLAFELLGQLEAFPDASMDVILDIRDRLARPRVHFRAALAQVARDLEDVNPSRREAQHVVADLRRRVIAPALEEIQVELESLGVRRTLLRVASDRMALTTAAATVTAGAGAGGGVASLRAAAAAAAAAPIVAAAAKEMDFREILQADLKTRPYWLLHEAAKSLAVR